ncbi:MAG TPA: SCO family protein [Flavobacteriaceae bacterium]|nr:SCO family protein [Flavobacteriaceae bacterium]
MIDLFKRFRFVGIVLLVLSVIMITVMIRIVTPEKVLPIYQPSQVDTELVDTTMQYIRKYHKIADFALHNQNGELVTQNDYEDKIYVADFFFTTCQTICIPMKNNMLILQEGIKDKDQVLLLSHTVTPEFDTVEQLRKFADERGVIDEKWNLVTGEKKQIYDLARKSYLVAKDDEYSEYDLIHTENFVLIDSKKRIRGYYDGTDEKVMQELLEDIDILLAEENEPSK